MIQNRGLRQIIRNILVISNIILILVLILVSIFGAYYIKQRLSHDASENSQFYVSAIDDEFGIDELDDYGQQSNTHNIHNDKMNDKGLDQSKGSGKSKAKIAIVLTNLGLNKKGTQMAFSLPAEVNFGFVPYTSSIKYLVHKSIERKHEVYLYLPLSSSDIDYPGKFPLLLTQSEEINRKHLVRILSGFNQIHGIYTRNTEIFTEKEQNFNLLMSIVQERDMKLVLGSYNSNIENIPDEMRKYVSNSSILIDNTLDATSIHNTLKQVAALAKIHGKIVCYAQGYPVTISILNEWIKNDILTSEDVELVGLSNI